MSTIRSALRFSLSLCYMLGAVADYGQAYQVEHFSMQNILPSNEVYVCITDKEGYAWIGTESGLLRYDGRDALYFDQLQKRGAGSIYEIHMDTLDRIWLHSSRGGTLLMVGDSIISPLSSAADHTSFNMGHEVDADGNTWIGSLADGYFRYDVQGDASNFGSDLFKISDLYAVDSNSLVMTSYDQLLHHNLKTDQLDTIVSYEGSNIPRSVRIQDTLYLFLYQEILTFDLATMSPIRREAYRELDEVIHVSVDQNDKIVIGTRTSLLSYDNGVFTEHPINPYIDGSAVSYYHEDAKGNTWVSTLNNGLYRLHKTPFSAHPFMSQMPVRSIHQSDDDIIFGSIKGQYIQQTKAGDIQYHQFDDWAFEGKYLAHIEDPPYTWDITDNTICLERPKGQDCIRFSNRQVVYDDENQTLYTAKISGVFKISLETYQWLLTIDLDDLFEEPYFDGKLLYDKESFDITKSADGTIWYSTNTGLYSYDGQRSINWGERHASLSKELRWLSVGHNGLYISTHQDELFFLNTDNGLLDEISQAHSICGYTIKDIEYDKWRNTLWIAHNHGISAIYQDKTAHTTCLGYEDGLPNASINKIYCDEDRLLIGTEQGVYTLSSFDVLGQDQDYFSLIINEKTELGQVRDTEGLTKLSDKNDYLRFDAISMSYGKGIKYQYRINESGKWVSTEDERIPLDRLKYGDNQIELVALNDQGKRSKVEIAHLYLASPWYRHPALWIVSALSLGLLFYSGVLVFQPTVIKNKIYAWLNIKPPPIPKLNIKITDGSYINIPINEIQYIKAAGNYIDITTIERQYTARMPLSTFLQEVSDLTNLRQVHRSYVVNLDHMTSINQKYIKLDEQEIPYSEKYREIIVPYKKRLSIYTI